MDDDYNSLELVLGRISRECQTCMGSSFVITYVKSSGHWKFNFLNLGVSFENVEPISVCREALDYIKFNKEPLAAPTNFTLFNDKNI